MSTAILTQPAPALAWAAPARDRARRLARSPKGLLALVFLPLLVLGGTPYGWALVLPHLASALAGAALVAVVAGRLRREPWRWPASALLSGTIVAFVLGPEQPWGITLAVGALATASRQLLVSRRGHVFNPAALALLLAIPLFGTGQSWWGALSELSWPWIVVLLAGGALVVDRVNKWPLVLTFLGATYTLLSIVALANPLPVAELFREPFVQATFFLAAFMLTDPPTSPGRYVDQVWIGLLVAVVSCVAQLVGAGQAYLLVGLLAGNVGLAARRWLPPTRSGAGVPAAHATQR